MSPEVKKHEEYFYNTDCWSVGCVLYELITLVRFYDKRIETDERIQEEINSLDTLDQFKDLLRKMLQINRANRAESRHLRFQINS